MTIKKVVIPAAGFETRFYPLSKIVPKPLLPLVDLPIIDYIAQEARDSGIEEVVFVLSEDKKGVMDYFRHNEKLEEKLLKTNNGEKNEILTDIIHRFDNITFSSTKQLTPKGDGDAILKAQRLIKKESFALMFSDDVFYAKHPVLSQLIKVFKTSKKPILGLSRIPSDQVCNYGSFNVSKIANRLFKINDVVEKPKPGEEPSNLVFNGRAILTPEIFSFLKKTQLNEKGELILTNAIKLYLQSGGVAYGYEIEGEWLECGNKEKWLKSSFYLASKKEKYKNIFNKKYGK